MKVVLFCGGYGMRMRGEDGAGLPKPMQLVGPRPLLWHVMRYYAHFGHTEFVLALGYGGNAIKDYFVHYQETASNDFVLRGGRVELLGSDIADWTITFVDTGLETAIGERLRRVCEHLSPGEPFLANYADVLTDAPLDTMVERFHTTGAAASMMVVPPPSSFHYVEPMPLDEGPIRVDRIHRAADLPLRVNGGYFVLSPEVFDHLPENGDLVEDACSALAAQGRLIAQEHTGFWKPADTFKERAELDALWAGGQRPWAVWERPPAPFPALEAVR
ncbi:glucose-1-phosphate cytidylyltransferase [Nocardioides mangrovicus]|uniref:Glucose-1-phosphate cytidylyltransferase n=1 Tax=Nocardioides mangrovicus TaxID=2478913 RepID=A0A3L8NZJ8_9ACTN|nr:glucose-1-phosphate cytidylyltransferase [Nocardioides mangrovicus]RLV48620.1 glucose-1-phosphate cytidylyltransferase [Nocardioides mangrovicus]